MRRTQPRTCFPALVSINFSTSHSNGARAPECELHSAAKTLGRKRASEGNAGRARSALRGGAGKFFAVQRRSRLPQTRPPDETRQRSKLAAGSMWPIFFTSDWLSRSCGWIFTACPPKTEVHASSSARRRKSRSKKRSSSIFYTAWARLSPKQSGRLICTGLIVEGASRILDAHGGALYMTDRSRNKTGAVLYFERLSAAGGGAAHDLAASRDCSGCARKYFCVCIPPFRRRGRDRPRLANRRNPFV